MNISHDPNLHNRPSNNGHRLLTVFLVVLTVIFGLAGFILCIAGELSRSKVTRISRLTAGNIKWERCYYSRSGKAPYAFAMFAMLLFFLAMFTEQVCILTVVNAHLYQAAAAEWSPPLIKDLVAFVVAQAQMGGCMLCLLNWLCFEIAIILLMIASIAESGHSYDWTKPTSECLKVHPGVFATAGAFGLLSVFLGVALHNNAVVGTQRLHTEANMGRQPL